MKAIEIKPEIFWVGAKDWSVRNFHGYKTSRGSSYNSYLIMDEKVTLVDTVKATHVDDLVDRISRVTEPSKIDYIVINHVEMDHSGALPDFMKLAPNAQILTSANGEKALRAHFEADDWNIRVVKTGEEVSIGKRTLTFVHTPMLHWPDSMVTYIAEEKLLLSNDGFGQHIASDFLFDDECNLGVIYEEAAKYYANILYPLAAPCQKALKALSGVEIEMIAPSHGVIWRSNPAEILKLYNSWSLGEDKNKAVIVYDSMWGTTQKMARDIASAFEDRDIPVLLRDLKSNHISDIVPDLLDAKYVAVGTAVLNGTMLPTVAAFMSYIKGLKPKKKGFAFGSYGWGAVATKELQELMGQMGWSVLDNSSSVKFKTSSDSKAHIDTQVETLINL